MKGIMIAVAFLRDVQVKTKEDKKIEKYRSLKDEITRLWDIEIVIGISVNANVLGAVTKCLLKKLL